MKIPDFDADYTRRLLQRLEKLQPDAKPAWGAMTPDQLIPHLASIVKYSMGRTPPIKVSKNPIARRVIGPLLLAGIIPILKNVKLPQAVPRSEDDTSLEILHAVIEDYFHQVETGKLQPMPHPLFGDIGIDGWARFHVIHFEHHLKQFNL